MMNRKANKKLNEKDVENTLQSDDENDSEKADVKDEKKKRESVRDILKKFGHVVQINHHLCKWIIPCNVSKNIVIAALPYVGIVYGCRILDGLVAKRPKTEIMNQVYQFAIITLLLTLLFSVLDKIGNALRDSIRYRIQAQISEKSVNLDYQDLEKQETMQILTAALEGEEAGGGVYWFSDKLGTLIGDGASIVYAFVVLFPLLLATTKTMGGDWMTKLISSRVSVIVVFLLNLCSMFVFMWISKRGNQKQYEIYEESIDAVRKDDYFYREILNRYPTGKEIRIYGMQDLLLKDMQETWDEKCNIEHKRIAIQRRIRLQFQIVQVILLLLSYVIIGARGVMGAITAAEVVKYVSTLTALGGACQYLVEHYENLLLNMQYLHHYYEYLQIPNHKESGDRDALGIEPAKMKVEFCDVSFRYPGSKKNSLDHVSMSFTYGEKIALVGPNGAGKTTLVMLLSRLYEPTSGCIKLNGVDIREYDYQSYRDLFGVVFQDFKLFAMDVAQNVAASEEYDEKRVWECLDKAEIGNRVRSMEHGVQTQLYNVGVEGVEVSGGEAQKIAIARALYKDAPFIILDEPTSALDPISEYQIYAGFDKLVKHKTSLYISHRMSSCRFCQRILVLEQGKLTEEGSHEELLQLGGVYAKMWNAQAKHYQKEA